MLLFLIYCFFSSLNNMVSLSSDCCCLLLFRICNSLLCFGILSDSIRWMFQYPIGMTCTIERFPFFNSLIYEVFTLTPNLRAFLYYVHSSNIIISVHLLDMVIKISPSSLLCLAHDSFVFILNQVVVLLLVFLLLPNLFLLFHFDPKPE
jgi:hypothetical protein